jgi:hypothetical protein
MPITACFWKVRSRPRSRSFLDRRRDLGGDVLVEVGLDHQRLGDARAVPAVQLLAGLALDEQGDVRRRVSPAGRLADLPAHLQCLAGAGALLAVEDVRLGGLGVPGLYQDLLDHVLNVLDSRSRLLVVLLQEEGNHPGQLMGQIAVLAAHGLGGLEHRVGYLPLVEGNHPAVALPDFTDPAHLCLHRCVSRD